MLEFPEWLTIPLSDWVEAIMDWVEAVLGGFFGVIGDLVLTGVYGPLADSFEIKIFLWQIPAVWWAFLILVLVVLAVIIATVIAWRTTHRLRLVIIISASLTAIAFSALFGLLGIESLLLLLPWWLVVLAVGYIAWRVIRKWWAGPMMAICLIIIGCFR